VVVHIRPGAHVYQLSRLEQAPPLLNGLRGCCPVCELLRVRPRLCKRHFRHLTQAALLQHVLRCCCCVDCPVYRLVCTALLCYV
jgi:hypothetical protein